MFDKMMYIQRDEDYDVVKYKKVNDLVHTSPAEPALKALIIDPNNTTITMAEDSDNKVFKFTINSDEVDIDNNKGFSLVMDVAMTQNDDIKVYRCCLLLTELLVEYYIVGQNEDTPTYNFYECTTFDMNDAVFDISGKNKFTISFDGYVPGTGSWELIDYDGFYLIEKH